MSTIPISAVQAMFETAKDTDRINHYKKCKKIDARPAIEGEVIITILNGEKETKQTTKRGDFVARAKGKNKEEYIIDAVTFKKCYVSAGGEVDENGFKEYNPIGEAYAFRYHGDNFSFETSCGEEMIVCDNDYIASVDRDELDDIYRIEKNEFEDTYERIN